MNTENPSKKLALLHAKLLLLGIYIDSVPSQLKSANDLTRLINDGCMGIINEETEKILI